MLGGFAKALLGDRAPLLLLLRRLSFRELQLRQAEAARRKAEIVESQRAIAKILVRRDRREQVVRFLVVLVEAFDERQRESVSGGGGVLMIAALADELAELAGGERIVALVVGLAGAVEQHLCHLVLGELGMCRVSSEPRDQSEQERTNGD